MTRPSAPDRPTLQPGPDISIGAEVDEPHTAPASAARAPHFQRVSQGHSLTPTAHAWLAGLPPRYQPLATARRFPHIVNRFAALWDAPTGLPGYFKELLLSTRPGEREGFSFDVLTELSDLQSMLAARQGSGSGGKAFGLAGFTNSNTSFTNSL